MSVFQAAGAVIAAILLVYLFVAILRPELFS